VDVLTEREIDARRVNDRLMDEITELKAELAGLRCELEDANVGA
jgi:hypothetical protein